jgi:hypothetical protein
MDDVRVHYSAQRQSRATQPRFAAGQLERIHGHRDGIGPCELAGVLASVRADAALQVLQTQQAIVQLLV